MEDLDTHVLRTALAWHRVRLPVVLVTVTRTWGSSPRPPGSLMAINSRGETVGSVSGGCIEDDLISRVRLEGVETVCAGLAPTVLRYGISADQAHRFGLPCGGTIELVLEPVHAQSQLDNLLEANIQRQSTARWLYLHSGRVELRPGNRDGVPEISEHRLVTYFGPQHRLIAIGAGDLTRFLCDMARSLNFEIVVCDPREEHRASWTLDGVPVSHEMPDDLVQRLKPDARTAIVTLTHDPKLDDLTLIDALRSEAFYVGAIGSRKHTAQRRERLRKHFGLSDIELSRLHGPAGLYIASKTPAEIALSIMAEVVAAKNGMRELIHKTVSEGKESADAARASAETEFFPDSCGV